MGVKGYGGWGGAYFCPFFRHRPSSPSPSTALVSTFTPYLHAEIKRFRLAAKVCLNYNVSFNLLYLAGKRSDR